MSVITYEMLVEIWILKAILMRRSTGEEQAIRPWRKAILVKKWQRTWLDSSVSWKEELASNETGYLDKDLSKVLKEQLGSS